ncbi:MAG: cytochrome b/b6 domain-containing protein, partial [Sphingomonas sp.]
FVGGSTARFTGFVRGPGAVLAYLRRRTGPAHGHNPLGGWSVVLMLLLLSVQVGLGLFASDEDGFDAGPLSHLVSFESAQRLLENHETLFNILLGLIGLHVLAVLFYWLRGDNLVRPMIDGRRGAAEGLVPLRAAPARRFAIVLILAAGIPLWIGFGP